MQEAHVLARANTEKAQKRMEKYFNRRAVAREFKQGNLVLILRPSKQFQIQNRYQGPCMIVKNVAHSVISTPDKR